MLHGGPGVSSDYLGALDSLAGPTLQLVTYDQRGAGRSTVQPSETYSEASYVGDLERVRIAIGADRIHVLGHSWGGLLALMYAAQHADRMLSLTLIDSAPPWKQATEAGNERFGARLAALIEQGIVPKEVPPDQGDDCRPGLAAIMPVYFSNPRHPAAKLEGPTCHNGPQKTWDTLGEFDFRPSLRRVQIRTLVIHGADDPFGRSWADEVAGSLPAANPELLVIPHCGHMPWLECPTPFYDKLRAFLGAGGGSPKT
ncbi:MAG: alpha/beta fold hydrolase [Kofleriaceae bacterium]